MSFGGGARAPLPPPLLKGRGGAGGLFLPPAPPHASLIYTGLNTNINNNHTDLENGPIGPLPRNRYLHLHNAFFSDGSPASGSKAAGRLGRLGLSGSVADSLWAASMVRSRTFSDEVGGEGLTLMVPFCDVSDDIITPRADPPQAWLLLRAPPPTCTHALLLQ